MRARVRMRLSARVRACGEPRPDPDPHRGQHYNRGEWRQPNLIVGTGTYNFAGETGLKLFVDEESSCSDNVLRLGKYVSLAENIRVHLCSDHRIDWVSSYPFLTARAGIGHLRSEIAHRPTQLRSKGDVIVGNDVWICDGVTILSGVTIHDGAVVGAGAVVTKDVPAYSVVVGNPARVVKMRFDEPTIAALMAVRWWDWSKRAIEEHLHLLTAGDMDAFLDAAAAAGQHQRAIRAEL